VSREDEGPRFEAYTVFCREPGGCGAYHTYTAATAKGVSARHGSYSARIEALYEHGWSQKADSSLRCPAHTAHVEAVEMEVTVGRAEHTDPKVDLRLGDRVFSLALPREVTATVQTWKGRRVRVTITPLDP